MISVFIFQLKNLTFDEMLQLFQELLQDVLGGLFEEEQVILCFHSVVKSIIAQIYIAFLLLTVSLKLKLLLLFPLFSAVLEM